MNSQVRGGIMNASADATAQGDGATITMTTLEARTFVLRLDESGVRIISATDNEDFNRSVFDCVNSLLLNVSVGFKQYFNSSLAAALALAVHEQRVQPPDFEEAED